MQKVRDVLRHELIGLHAEVVNSKNNSLIGIKGKIIGETKNMLTVEMDNVVKRIIKNMVVINLKTKIGRIRVDGRLLVGRPEDRIKKVRRLR